MTRENYRVGFDIASNGDTTLIGRVSQLVIPYEQLQNIAHNARNIREDSHRYLAPHSREYLDKQPRFSDDDVAHWLVEHGESITLAKAAIRALETNQAKDAGTRDKLLARLDGIEARLNTIGQRIGTNATEGIFGLLGDLQEQMDLMDDQDKPTVLTENGKPIAAVVPIEVLEFYMASIGLPLARPR